MATHSSVLAWRIPGTEEPGGLPSMGSHRVGHDWSDLAAAAAAVPNSGKKRLRHLKYLLRGGEKRGFPGSASGKEPTCQCRRYKRHIRDMGSIPWLVWYPGRGHGSPLQYPCLENPVNREAWGATIHRVAESRTRLKWLSRQAGKETPSQTVLLRVHFLLSSQG